MVQFHQDMWSFLGIWIFCLFIRITDTFHLPYDDDGPIPVIACEDSKQVYAVACVTGRGHHTPGWVGWKSNGERIDIDYEDDEFEKYSRATDGVKHAYLLISGIAIGLENDGDRYNCYNPQHYANPLSQEELQSLSENAAVLQVLPADRCDRSTTRVPPTVTTKSITSLIQKETTPTKKRIKEMSKRPKVPTEDGRDTSTLEPTSKAEIGGADSQRGNQDPQAVYEILGTTSLVQFAYVMVTFVCLLFVIHLLLLFKMYRLWTRMNRKDRYETPPEPV